MSDTYQLHLYKRLDRDEHLSLLPFIRMLWEHGITFAPHLVPAPLEWDETLQGTCRVFVNDTLEDVPLLHAIPQLEHYGGSLDLYDKQMSYNCWFEWITSPGKQQILSLCLMPVPWALQVRIHLGWHGTAERETYLLAGHQQGIASFLHWSGLICQWLQPDLAGSYEEDPQRGYRSPPDLLADAKEGTFPPRARWGWLTYVPAAHVSAALLSDLVATPALTVHSLMPSGLLVYRLPSEFRYETRAAYELEKAQLFQRENVSDRDAAIDMLHERARVYKRAIELFQDARGEALARIGLTQVMETIETIRRTPPERGTHP